MTLTFWLQEKGSEGEEPQVGTKGQLQCSMFRGPGSSEERLGGEESRAFGQGPLGSRLGLRPLPKPAHRSGNSTKKAAFRKRPKLQSAATSQWERKPGSVLTTHLRMSVWEKRGDS